MTNKLYSALVAVAGGAVLVGAPAAHAELPEGLDLGVKFSQQFQDVDAESPTSGQEHSFEFPRVGLDINAQFTPWLSMYAEFTNEQSDFSGSVSQDNEGDIDRGVGVFENEIVNDLTLINVDLLKASGSAAADNNDLTLQFGTPVGGLSNYFNGSDGSLVQTNPLIGNAPFRPIDAMTGAKLIGSHDIGGAVKSVSWDAGYYTSNFFPSRAEDRGESFNLRGKLTFAGGFSAGAGFVEAEDNGAFFNSNNDSINVGGTYATQVGVGGGNGGANPNFGSEATGWNLEGQYKVPSGMMLEGSKVLGKYTTVEGDGDNDGQELESFKVLGQAYVVPDQVYVAARWQLVTNESDGISNNDELERYQLGGGVWLADNTLLKAEYFEQTEQANLKSGVGTGFDGFAVELSSTF